MKRSRLFSTLISMLCILLLTSCAASVVVSFPASATPDSSSLPISSSSTSTSPFSIPASSARVESASPQPVAQTVSRPDSKTLPQQRILDPILLSSFDGLAYTYESYDVYSHVRAAMEGPEGVFFAAGDTLYYSDNSRVYRLMGDVYSIAGADQDGLYLIVHDDTLPSQKLTYVESSFEARHTSLVHYHPVTGMLTPILTNVQNALVTGENHDMMYYAKFVPQKNEVGYALTIYRRTLPYGPDTLIFTDELLHRGSEEHPYVVAAHDILFYDNYMDGQAAADVLYPNDACFPHDRILVLSSSGSVQMDTQKRELITEHPGYKHGYYQGNNSYYPSAQPAKFGPYALRWTEGHNWYLVQNETEKYWGHSYDIEERNGLLYFLADSYYGNKRRPFDDGLIVYDGEQTYQVLFWESPNSTIRMFKVNGSVYIITHGRGSQPSGDRLAVYKTTGTRDNPSSVRFLAALESEEVTFDDYNCSVYYWVAAMLSCMVPPTKTTMDRPLPSPFSMFVPAKPPTPAAPWQMC